MPRRDKAARAAAAREYRQRDPERWRAHARTRSKAKTAAFAEAFSSERLISDVLFTSLSEVATIGVLKQTKEQLLDWVKRQQVSSQDEIILLGLSDAIRIARTRIRSPNIRRKRQISSASAKRHFDIRQEKSRAFDRIVERLDLTDVNGKLLGDCTRPDLLRAAVQSEERAGAATLDAAMFRQLAEIVGNGTVREASNRGKVVALLTTRYDTEN